MRAALALIGVVGATVALAACATSPPVADPQPPAAAVRTTAPAGSTTGTDASSTTASTPVSKTATANVPIALDPCQLVTAAEASTLAGVSIASGKSDTNPDNSSKRCLYGSALSGLVAVELVQLPDPASAQQQWNDTVAKANERLARGLPGNPKVSTDFAVAGLADRAATASVSATAAGKPVGATAIYLLKGATYLSFSDLSVGRAAAGDDAMKAEARTALGRIP